MTAVAPRRRFGYGAAVTPEYVAAIDQGTTSSRCIVFDSTDAAGLAARSERMTRCRTWS